MRHISTIALCAVLALAAACGDGSGGMDPRAAKLLDAQIAAARDAAARGDIARATTLLHTLDGAVATLRAQHLVSDSRAAEIRVASVDTQNALARYAPSTTTTSTVPSTTVPPASTVPSQDRHKPPPPHDGGHKRGGGGD
jgi:hypothetical protein